MSLILKEVTICDPSSSWNGKQTDILIEDGKIASIGPNSGKAKQIINLKDAFVSPGLFDTGTFCGEPGFEHRETLESLCEAASKGGFTGVMIWPNTIPCLDNRSAIRFVKERSVGNICEVYPYGAISAGCEGKDLAELMDMHEGGAIAFSDGLNSVQHGGLVLRALDYVKSFDGLVVQFCEDKTVFPKGHIHEGAVSTGLGTKGIPESTEVISLHKQIELLRYTNSKLHIQGLSSARSVDMIRQAKKEGLRITASVSVWNIAYTDESVADFNVNFKFIPPLREEKDRIALIKGLKDGTIDCIYSHHMPWEPEMKDLEFTFSKAGSISVQTAFLLSLEVLSKQLSTDKIVEKWSLNPRNIFSLPDCSIQEKKLANLTIFQQGHTEAFNLDSSRSFSINTPLMGREFKNRVAGVIRGKKDVWF